MGGWTHSSQRRPQLCKEKGKNMWLKTSRDWSRAEYWNTLLLLLLLRVHFHHHIKILRILRPAQVALAVQPNAFSVPGSGSGSGSGATVTWFATRHFGFTAKPHYTVVKSETSEHGCDCFVITGWGLSEGRRSAPGPDGWQTSALLFSILMHNQKDSRASLVSACLWNLVRMRPSLNVNSMWDLDTPTLRALFTIQSFYWFL